MADYNIISKISEKMISILKQELVPELIVDEAQIGLKKPDERNDISLGVYLYDLMISDEVRQVRMVESSNLKQMRYPPIGVNLYYMITPCLVGDERYTTIQEQKIIGKVLQVFNDKMRIPFSEIEGELGNDIDLRVELLKLDLDAKLKLWGTQSSPYRLSLFYKVSPVFIESSRVKEIQRVKEVDIRIKTEDTSVEFGKKN